MTYRQENGGPEQRVVQGQPPRESVAEKLCFSTPPPPLSSPWTLSSAFLLEYSAAAAAHAGGGGSPCTFNEAKRGRGCRSLLATHAKASGRIELVIPALKATSFARWGTWVSWRRGRNHAAPLWESSTHRVLRHKQVRGQVAPWTLVAALWEPPWPRPQVAHLSRWSTALVTQAGPEPGSDAVGAPGQDLHQSPKAHPDPGPTSCHLSHHGCSQCHL